MFGSFDQRSNKLERLDTGDYTPQEYALWQAEAKLINRWLGDSRAVRLALSSPLKKLKGRVSIIDVGAGSGELLRAAGLAAGQDRMAFLVGAELNADAARSIAANRTGSEMFAVQCDALRLPFADDCFDFAISSLFMHHLTDEQAVTLIAEMARVSRRRFFVIDLHRHAAAYYLYRLFAPILLQRFTVEDGSLSILRAFRPAELLELARTSGIVNACVTRRAAFRLVLSGSKPSSD